MTRESSLDVEREFSRVSETNAKALNLVEDSFRDSEEKYRMLLDGIEDYAIFMIDPQGRILSWNAGAERIKGYKAEEIIGRNFSCFFLQHDIDRGRPEEVLRLTAAYGRHEEKGMRVRKDGSRFVASVTFTALRDRNGNLRGFSEFSHDLSESKASEARYRGLLEAAPDAMVVVNSGGEIVLLNVQAETQFGYRRDELLGQQVKNIIPEGFAERLVADDLRSAEDALAQQIGTGIELIARRKDGSEFPIEIMLSPLESAEGILVTAAIRDISVRKEAERHLAQMEGRYRGLLEAAPDAMVVVNQAGEIVLLNLQAEKQFGYRRDELVGQKVKSIIPEGFAERLIADDLRSAEDALAQQIGTGIELTGRRKDGSEFPIEIMLSPLESTEGILVTAAIRDISVRKAAEEHLTRIAGELYNKHRLLDSVVEGTSDLVYIRDLENRFTFANRACANLFGRSVGQIVGSSMRELLPKASFDAVSESDRETVSSGETHTVEEAAEINGSMRLFLTTKGPYRDADERIIGTIGIAREVTERRRLDEARLEELKRDIVVRKAAEEHLAQLEARYRGLLEAAPDAMVVVNQGGEIVLLNVQAEKQFGYRRDELVGQKVKNIIPEGFAERLIADGTRTAAEALAQQIGMGIELIGRRKNGSDFPIEIMLSPLESAEGILVTAAIRDITERKRAEVALQVTEERLRLLINGVVDYAIFMLDPEGRITTWGEGAQRMKGYRAEEIIGQHFSKFYLPEEAAQQKPAQELKIAAQQGRFEEEGWRMRKGGSVYWASVIITPLFDKSGQLRGFGKLISDISERKKAEERLARTMEDLKRSNEELQQFAYVASHDLQEPLRMVASYTELLAQRYKGRLDSDADQFIAYAVDGSTRMQALIQDLLAYSRAGANGTALREISSENALKEAVASLRAAIEESGAVVTHDSLPAITTDGRQLTQVFQNLIGNAIKYHGAQVPNVHVSAAKNGGNEWIFCVRDNGMGIDPQYFERIFIIFQRLHGREEFKGTGIGLAICKKIVERLGGRIWVESKPEKGSSFYFGLPERDGK